MKLQWKAVIVCLVVIAAASLAVFVRHADASKANVSCQANQTLSEASQNGALPAIVAAIHGGALPKNSVLNCAPRAR
jgi:hypothetical protein